MNASSLTTGCGCGMNSSPAEMCRICHMSRGEQRTGTPIAHTHPSIRPSINERNGQHLLRPNASFVLFYSLKLFTQSSVPLSSPLLSPISRPKSNRAIIGNAVKSSSSAAAAMQWRMFLFLVCAVARDSEQTNERATPSFSNGLT